MPDGANYKVKGSVFRAYVGWLERSGSLSSITPRLTPETVRLVQRPPLASSWMDSAPLDEIVERIEETGGIALVRRAAVDVLRDQLGPLLTPTVRNIMRLIGGTPPTLYSRWDDLIRTVMLDVEFEWRATSEYAGVLRMRYLRGRNVPMRAWHSTTAGLEHVLTLCGKKGVVSDPIRLDEQTAEFEIKWS